MSGNDVASPPGYEIVAARSVSDQRLRAFAASVLPGSDPERMLQSWWRRADPSCAVAAVHQATGVMAGLCAGRPSEWQIGGNRHPAVAICGWYVDPRHGGRLLGRRLVRQFDAPGRMMYAYSMSEDAIQYLARLGWVGPYTSTLLALPLPRLAGIVRSIFARTGAVTLQDYTIEGGILPGELAARLDQIEARMPHDAPAHMLRGEKEWRWRLAASGHRSYRISVAARNGEPLGFVALRLKTPGAARSLGGLKTAIVTDLVAAEGDAQLLIGRGIGFAGDLGARLVLASTTVPSHQEAYAACGFLSSRLPLLGRPLRRRAPQFMWRPKGPGADLSPQAIALSFSDSDVDLNL